MENREDKALSLQPFPNRGKGDGAHSGPGELDGNELRLKLIVVG